MPARTIIGICRRGQISLSMNTDAHVSPALERDAADQVETFLAAHRAATS